MNIRENAEIRFSIWRCVNWQELVRTR